jgi:hypothetical protein
MRSHGVPSFPDPIPSAGGVQFPIDSPTTLNSPAFQSAHRACQYLLPRGRAPSASASHQVAAVKYAQCMRLHGVPNYPDPTFANGQQVEQPLSDYGINPQAPAFIRAEQTCRCG